MDFFKSVFSDDPDPPKSETNSDSDSPKHEDPEPSSPPKHSGSASDFNAGLAWSSFGGLIKTLATRSESVIETYRRDLKEFGTGLRKEIEVAHGSLETVGHVIDEFGNSVLKGTAQIISQGKDAILASDNESDSEANTKTNSTRRSFNSKRYSRFNAQVSAIQADINTYCEEPEDLEDYNKWRSEFILEEQTEETEKLLEENGEMKNIFKRVVPNSVDNETFWCRYFYRVFKLKKAEDVRANLVKRAISTEEEEELSWDVDDDSVEEEDERKLVPKANVKKEEDVGNDDPNVDSKNASLKNKMDSKDSEQTVNEKEKEIEIVEESRVDSSVADEKEEKTSDVNEEGKAKEIAVESSSHSLTPLKVDREEKNDGVEKEDLVLKSDEKVASEGKNDNGESSNGKDSDFSVVSSQPSMPEEEDLGWDEIEDLSSIDDNKKVTHGGSPSPKRADIRKRLSAAEEEDLSWDIEDDDEPVKH